MLRYGRLYGPGTGFDAAVRAAGLAVVRGTTGIYNIAEDDGTLACDKAKRELGRSAARQSGAIQNGGREI